MKKELTPQVPTEVYFSKKLLRKNNFLAMYEQINAVAKTNPEKILEIGHGNGNVSLLLKNFGYNVTTCDFDKSLKPDFVADVRKLPFKDNSFDTVMACEILEHLPFKEFPKALQELKRVSKKFVIISLPNSCISFGALFKIKIPFIGRFFDFSFSLPYDWLNPKKFKFNSEHYWEIGRKGYSKKRILNVLKKFFTVVKYYPELIQPEHYFFILKNINKNVPE